MRARANGALALLAAVVGRNRPLCAEVLAAFDFTLASLPKLAAGPKGSLEDTSGADAESKDILRQPSRQLYIKFAMAFLSGDRQTTRVALSKRALLAGVLHALASDPPKVIARVCRQLLVSVLAPEAGVPARLQAAVLGDGALDQLMAVTARVHGDPAAGDAAFDVLAAVCTEPSHGLCPAQGTHTNGDREVHRVAAEGTQHLRPATRPAGYPSGGGTTSCREASPLTY